jgi:DNA-binding response OmpR family regulator
MRPVKILYAEDNVPLASVTRDNLEQNNYAVTHCHDGHSCFEAFASESFDICILDLRLPKMNGAELTVAMRKVNPGVPIFFLASDVSAERSMHGLKLDPDEYLVKPFNIDELLMKIESVLANSSNFISPGQTVYPLGKYLFSATNCLVYNESEKIKLNTRESGLLKYLLDNKNKVLKRDQILTALWGHDDYFMGRSLNDLIARLRKILLHEKGLKIENLQDVGFRYSDKG